MLNFEETADLLSGLVLMKFFPADPGARLELAKMISSMASTPEQVEWLVQRCISLYTEWPGAREIRACFCSKFRPADGLTVGSTVYPDGIPSERRIDPAPLAALPPGHVASADRQLDDGIRRLAAGKDLNAPVERRQWTREELAEIERADRAAKVEGLRRRHQDELRAAGVDPEAVRAEVERLDGERKKSA